MAINTFVVMLAAVFAVMFAVVLLVNLLIRWPPLDCFACDSRVVADVTRLHHAQASVTSTSHAVKPYVTLCRRPVATRLLRDKAINYNIVWAKVPISTCAAPGRVT